MTHLSEERNIPTEAAPIWRVISDTKRWPQFFATPKERGKLRAVEYLEGATSDGLDVKRRLSFTGLPAWDEQVSRWAQMDSIAWLGIRNPGQRYWQQQMELIPGKGFTTLRWDIYYKLSAPRGVAKIYKRTLEDLMLASLERVERLAVEDANGAKA